MMEDDARQIGEGALCRPQEAWNAGNGSAFGAPSTDDADFGAFRGDHHPTREAIVAGRDVAWALAQELGRTPADGWAAVIAKRDAEVAAAGRALYPLHGIAGQVSSWIHAAEFTDIRYNIQVVAE